MILEQDPDTGYWTRFKGEPDLRLNTHGPEACKGRLCDIHNRRGGGEQATWPLNWRGDRGIMEVICPHGVGHVSQAQTEYLFSLVRQGMISEGRANAELVHGCCGCCAVPYTVQRRKAR